MLNELYELAVALDHHGLLRSATNPNVGTVGKALCLLIEIDRDGNPRGLRLLPKDETSGLWKHSKGNHNSFPAIRIQKPLLAFGESQKIDDETWRKAKVSEKITLLSSLDEGILNKSISNLYLSDWSINELMPVLSNDADELAALRQLIKCFPKSNDAKQFCAKLVSFLKHYVLTCDNEKVIDLIKELLVGIWDKKTKKYGTSCLTYYDVYETNDFQNKVISHETAQILILLLNQTSIKETQESVTRRGSLSGTPQDGVGNKYPNPNLPTLGLTYLYSKKSDTPCLTRYRMSGTKAFQAGKIEVAMISDALAFLTHKLREGKSWKAMADSNRDKPNLLLAYLTDDPQNDALLAQILDDPTDNEESESAFDAVCQQVLGSIKNATDKNPRSQINLIMLETLDPGRKQIVYANSLSAQQFRNNLLAWSEAARNCPPITIRVGMKGETREHKPACPGPKEICQLLKMYYTRSGSAKPLKQSAVSLHEIYRLYMPQSDLEALDTHLLSHILRITVGKVQILLGDVGQQLTIHYVISAAEPLSKQVKNICISVSLISILLWRLGVRKENYMVDASFNVGQFLKLADMLHKHYSVQVRNGGDEKKPLPTQLMGNEMLVIASENPVEALNRLKERIKIYLAWADTATGEGAGLARWILARFSEVSAKIAANGLPETFTPAEQAQVLLGYLAAIPYEKKEDDIHG